MEYGLCKTIAIAYVTQSHVLVMVEHFSKWNTLMSLPNKSNEGPIYVFFGLNVGLIWGIN
jgi:hypothetical protein